jgi:hypothetical protein
MLRVLLTKRLRDTLLSRHSRCIGKLTAHTSKKESYFVCYGRSLPVAGLHHPQTRRSSSSYDGLLLSEKAPGTVHVCKYSGTLNVVSDTKHVNRSIQTYGGRGVPSDREKSHHAIMYTGTFPPEEFPEERSGWSWDRGMGPPIRVIGDKPSDQLDPRSRVNFLKTYTVEHYVKVHHFGRVDPDQGEAILMSQFNSHWNIQPHFAVPPRPRPPPTQLEQNVNVYGPQVMGYSAALPTPPRQSGESGPAYGQPMAGHSSWQTTVIPQSSNIHLVPYQPQSHAQYQYVDQGQQQQPQRTSPWTQAIYQHQSQGPAQAQYQQSQRAGSYTQSSQYGDYSQSTQVPYRLPTQASYQPTNQFQHRNPFLHAAQIGGQLPVTPRNSDTDPDPRVTVEVVEPNVRRRDLPGYYR